MGGCVLISNSASVAIQDVVVQGGQAMNGGGIGIVNSKQVSMSNITVINNGISMDSSSQNMYGGGGYVFNCSSVTIASSSFSNNSLVLNSGSGYLNGGGIYIYLSSVKMIGPILIENNMLSSGGTGNAVSAGILLDTCSSPIIEGPLSLQYNSIAAIGALFAAAMQISMCPNARLTGPLTISHNTMHCQKSGNAHSAGVEFFASDNVVMMGPIVISNNLMIASAGSTGTLLGCGLEIYSSNYMSIHGPLNIENNTMTSAGKGSLLGISYIRNSVGCSLTGPILFQNNSLIGIRPVVTTTLPYIPPPLTNDTKHCSSVTIAQTSGSINDGSWGKYSPNIYCSWLISLPNAVDQAISMFQVNFTKLDTEQKDYVTIYDGPTSQSPLIGKFDGSLSNPQCISGLCPSVTQPILTSLGAMLVVFTSSPTIEFDGFELTWTTLQSNSTTGISSKLLDNADVYPSFGFGTCISIVASTVSIKNGIFHNNRNVHPFTSHGGAIVGVSSTITILDSVFQNNIVKSILAAGGAIATTSQSQVLCSNCTFLSNSAIAFGDKCYYSTAIQRVVCGAAFGGSIVGISGSAITVTQSSFRGDTSICACPNIDCENHGGSIGTLQLGSRFVLASSRCTAARLLCLDAASLTTRYDCPWAVGGCGYTDSATLSITDSIVEDSAATGASVGGGVFSTGTGIVNLVNATLRNNTARQGGGMGLEGFSFGTVINSSFVENSAISVGGGALVVEEASFFIYNSSFELNQASKASMLFSYNEDNTATYSAERISVITLPGSSALMIGKINVTSSINVWTCTWPGTVFSQDLSSDFFSISCDRCTEGTYAVDAASTETINRTCQPCPFGAICIGASPTSNGLLSLGGYWGKVRTDGVASFYPCPFGYCCPLQETCGYDFCQGGRIGRLCGRCAAGQGLRFFTEGCGDDSTCNDAGWAGFAVVVGSLVMALYLLVSSTSFSTGMISVLLYFYQVLPLVKSTSWKHTLPTVIIALQSIFSMTPSSGESGQSGGVCIQPSMVASRKLGIRMLLQGVVMGALVAVYALHVLLKRIIKVERVPKVELSQYLAASVRLAAISYITLVLIPLQMVQCIWMDEVQSHVWWWDASIQCYQGWQIGGFVAIGMLFPVPLMLIILLWKYWDCEARLRYKWQKQIRIVLTREYRPQRRWWLGVSLYRRFLLSVVFATITDANWRAIATMVLCLSFIVLNITCHPFKSSTTQRAETISLIILGILSTTTAPQLSQLQFGTRYDISNEANLEAIQFTLSITPAFMYILLSILRLVFKLLGIKQHTKAEGTTEINEDDENNNNSKYMEGWMYDFNWNPTEQHHYC